MKGWVTFDTVRGPRENLNHGEVFVSYSRQDKKLVGPVVELLSELRPGVFMDQGIKPGTKWEDELKGKLETCDLLVVFWCWHSSRSKWVQKEIQDGLEKGKAFIPLMLDDTPLSDGLSEWQGIDFKNAVPHRTSAGLVLSKSLGAAKRFGWVCIPKNWRREKPEAVARWEREIARKEKRKLDEFKDVFGCGVGVVEGPSRLESRVGEVGRRIDQLLADRG